MGRKPANVFVNLDSRRERSRFNKPNWASFNAIRLQRHSRQAPPGDVQKSDTRPTTPDELAADSEVELEK